MIKKSKKIFTLTGFVFGTLILSSTLTVGLSSCSNSTSNIIVPTSNSNEFTSIDNGNLNPMAAGVLTSKDGRNSLSSTYVNNLLTKWFKGISNSSLNASYNSWYNAAVESYNNQYNEYKNNKGKNWKQLFQKDVLDPVGGTKESYIQSEINYQLKDEFINNLFANDYLCLKQSSSTSSSSRDSSSTVLTSIKNSSRSSINNPSNINGSSGAGTKNNFCFSAEAIDSSSRTSVDYGYADFMEFLMDEWVYNELPLPLVMSLWKNGNDPANSRLFSSFFPSDVIGTEGSYKFQYFEPKSTNSQKLSTTDKFSLLITGLKNNKYIDTTTGLINLPNDYTEDSSTIMKLTAKQMFNGDFVTPFTAAALYKFNSSVFGEIDSNMGSTNSDSLVSDSIMKNFISTSTTNQKNSTSGVFNFPYSTTWTNPYSSTQTSVFLGEYNNMTGIIDTINITSATSSSPTPSNTNNNGSALNNFILTRDEFGVHLIGIDRLSQMIAATNGSTTGTTAADSSKWTIDNYKKVCNEIRNTWMYRAATDILDSKTNYDLMSELKSYLSDNFNELIFKYVYKFVSDNSNNVNNLFGPNVYENKLVHSNSNNLSDTNLGFDSNTDQSYINLLNQITSNSELSKLINNAFLLNKAESVLDFSNNLKSKIYANQESLINTENPGKWEDNGIAGVLPYTRDSNTGNFTHLVNIVNKLVATVNTNSTTTPSTPIQYRNANQNQINSDDSFTGTISKASDYVTYAKNEYQKAVASYVNSIGLAKDTTSTYIGKPTYFFTNNEYINNAINANSQNSQLSSIYENFYLQHFLTNQSPIITNIGKRSSRQAPSSFYNYQTNTLNIGNNSSTKGSSDWVKQSVQNAINQTYIINNLTSLTNIYSDGDWNTLNTNSTSSISNKANQTNQGFWNLAQNIWKSSYESSQYNFSINSNSSKFTTYESPDSAYDYQKFLITIEYLLDYDASTDTFSFSNLIDYLNTVTDNNNRAMVAWNNISSLIPYTNPTQRTDSSFGISSTDTTTISSVASVQSKVSSDATFKPFAIYLANTTPYSWFGINFGDVYNNISYNTNSSYWNTAPMANSSSNQSKSSEVYNTGFLGFQFESANVNGWTNSIIESAFDIKTYSDAPLSSSSNNGGISYYGALYQFGTRTDLESYVKNSLRTVNGLNDFFESLTSGGLPISQTSIDNIDDINQANLTTYERITKLSEAIVRVIQDTNQVPDNCFQKMSGMPLWNKKDNSNSTLFDTSSDTNDALRSEYVVTLFNNNDVNKIMTNSADSIRADGLSTTLNTTSDGFLGLNPITFFNAIVMLARDNTYLQNNAIDYMYEKIGTINVYDQRLISIFEPSIIANYSLWEEIINLK